MQVCSFAVDLNIVKNYILNNLNKADCKFKKQQEFFEVKDAEKILSTFKEKNITRYSPETFNNTCGNDVFDKFDAFTTISNKSIKNEVLSCNKKLSKD